MSIVDSHAHIVSADTRRYPPSPLGGDLDENVFKAPITAERLIELMDETGVERAVLVQRAHVYGYDNSYVIDSAERYPARFRAVICVDAGMPEAAASLQKLTKTGAVSGVRFVAPGLTSPIHPTPGLGTAWFDGKSALNCWDVARANRLSVCLHFYRWNRVECLLALRPLAERYSDVPIVLDHASNISGGQAHGFGIDETLTAIGRLPNTFQKLTAINYARLLSENENIASMTAAVAASCGTGKIVWGSDVGQSKGSYAELVANGKIAATQLLDGDAFLAETAKRIYWT